MPDILDGLNLVCGSTCKSFHYMQEENWKMNSDFYQTWMASDELNLQAIFLAQIFNN